jgi:heat shock transcription factor
MMDLINDTNARTGPNNIGMEFPEMLSQYENAHGNSPLTPDQRNTVLNMIASQSTTAGSNNALVSPTPPPALDLANLSYTQAEIDELARLASSQDARIREIHDAVAPFSPGGGLTGVNDGNYFSGDGVDPDHNAANIDLDQFLDAGAFYSGSSPMGASGGFDMDSYGDGQFDLSMDGANDAGRIIEEHSSAANSPGTEVKVEIKEEPAEDEQQSAGTRGPSKRRRKH